MKLRACQTNFARFVYVVCRFDKIKKRFQVFVCSVGSNHSLGQVMDALKVNRFGRTYCTGVALDQDMRTLIIDRILQEGGDRVTGYIPRSFRYFSEELRLSVNTVTKIWRQFYEELSLTPRAKGGTRWSKLSEYDLELIELLKIEKPSVSLAEIINCLQEIGGVDVSMAAVSRALKQILPSGPYTRKKLRRSPVNGLHLRTCFIHNFSSII